MAGAKNRRSRLVRAIMDDNGENVGVLGRRYLREEVAPGQLAAVPHPGSSQQLSAPGSTSGQSKRTPCWLGIPACLYVAVGDGVLCQPAIYDRRIEYVAAVATP